MASTIARRATLVANTNSAATIEGDFGAVEVQNVDGAARVFYTIGNVVDTTLDPTVNGTANGIFSLPAVAGASRVHDRPAREARTIVKLISSGTPVIEVQGLDPKAPTE